MVYQPAVIIGAPRSGTNMLRDVLTSLEGIATWPCDEINYIWRHGNVRFPSDEIPADRATPVIKSYIQQSFEERALDRRAGHPLHSGKSAFCAKDGSSLLRPSILLGQDLSVDLKAKTPGVLGACVEWHAGNPSTTHA